MMKKSFAAIKLFPNLDLGRRDVGDQRSAGTVDNNAAQIVQQLPSSVLYFRIQNKYEN
jgi:hypothetical protein